MRENGRDAKGPAGRRPRREPAGPRRREEVGTEKAKPRRESGAKLRRASAAHAALRVPVPSPGSSPVRLRGWERETGLGRGRRSAPAAERSLASSSHGSGHWCLLVLTPRSARDAFLRTCREGRGAGTRLSASRTRNSAPATVTRPHGPGKLRIVRQWNGDFFGTGLRFVPCTQLNVQHTIDAQNNVC